jgi:para-nitrobenzyl esterase
VTADITVETTAGAVRGTIHDGVSRFLGVPYAAPPFGPNRFAPPAPVSPWSGARDAVAYGPTAPKGPYSEAIAPLLPEPDLPGDDCLNLNVWTPDPSAKGLPVMVWIHGGSLRNGSNAVSIYSGQSFARDGVVLVSANYRLGVEGFAVFPDAPSNRGLLDVIAALRWVRDNVSAFGGDPDNVTVFGESAGAIVIGSLLVSPHASGLFRRAVMQSGPPHAVAPAGGARITELIAKRLGVAPTAAAFAAVPRQDLLAAQIEATRSGNPLLGGPGFAIVVDGDVVPADPMAALRGGAAQDIDLLVGYNRDEYRLWFVPSGAINKINGLVLRLALRKFKIPFRTARVYRRNRPGARPGEILGCIATDMLMRVPANRIAESRSSANTFVYEFGWETPVGGLGACHALELGFVFDTLDQPDGAALVGPNPPQDLADAMHRAWVDFARTGRPGWPGFDGSRAVMLFDTPTARVMPAPRSDELSLWP